MTARIGDDQRVETVRWTLHQRVVGHPDASIVIRLFELFPKRGQLFL
jgi:hypothetical protein